jgi:hypothetical protein
MVTFKEYSFRDGWVGDGNVYWCIDIIEKIVGAPIKLKQKYAVVRKDEYDIQDFKGKTFTIRSSSEEVDGVIFRGLKRRRHASINGNVGKKYLKADEGVSLVLLDLSVYDLK